MLQEIHYGNYNNIFDDSYGNKFKIGNEDDKPGNERISCRTKSE